MRKKNADGSEESTEEEEESVSLEQPSTEDGSAKRPNGVVVMYKHHKGKVWVLVGCAALIILIFIFIYWGLFNNYTWNNDYHVHQLETRINQQQRGNGLSYGASAVYSVARLLAGKEPTVLELCHRDSYDPVMKDGRLQFQRSDMSARARAMAQRQTASLPKNVLVSARLEMRYNVEIAPDVLRKNGLSETQRYQTLHYEVGSSHDRFSTIKLLVSSEDIYKQQPRIRQEVTICSNRPGSERLCSQRVSLGGLLRMNNTLLYPMEKYLQPRQDKKTPTWSPTSTPIGGGSGGTTQQNVDEEETDEEENDENEAINLLQQDQENLRSVEAELANNRQFHVLFYRETDASLTTSRDTDAIYDEYIALVIEPMPCKTG